MNRRARRSRRYLAPMPVTSGEIRAGRLDAWLHGRRLTVGEFDQLDARRLRLVDLREPGAPR